MVKGNFWRTGLESCALSPFIEADTSTASKTWAEEGSNREANYFILGKILEAYLYAKGLLPRSAINLRITPR